MTVGTNTKKRRFQTLLDALSGDEDEEPATASSSSPCASQPLDPSRPWLEDFQAFLRVVEVLPEGMGVLEWWGVRIYSY